MPGVCFVLSGSFGEVTCMASVYVSYTHQDLVLAQHLADKLRVAGHNVSIDTELQGGSGWADNVLRYIEQADAFIVLVSPAALESAWIQREISAATARRKRIIPVLVEDARLPPSLSVLQVVDARTNRDEALLEVERALDAVLGAQRLQPAPPAPAAAPVLARPGRNTRALLVGVLVVALLLIGVGLAAMIVVNNNTGQVNQRSTAFAIYATNTAVAAAIQASQTAIEWTATPTQPAAGTPTGTATPTSLPSATPRRTSTARAALSATPSPLPTSVPMLSSPDNTEAILTLTAKAAPIGSPTSGNGATIPPTMQAMLQTADIETLVADRVKATVVAIAALATSSPTLRPPTITYTPLPSPDVDQIVAGTVVAVRATDQGNLLAAQTGRLEELIASTSNGNDRVWSLVLGVLATLLALASIMVTLVVVLPLRGSTGLSWRRVIQPKTLPTDSQSPEPLPEEYEVFISSSDADRAWVATLVKDLSDLGFLVWWYAKDAPGLPFGREIKSAIFYTKVFVAVVSPDSMKSRHIEEEVRWADTYGRPIVPITCRPTSIEERIYGLAKGADIDFTNEREYKGAMELLIQAINHYLKNRLDRLQGTAITTEPSSET
jgi:hypothetical protein